MRNPPYQNLTVQILMIENSDVGVAIGWHGLRIAEDEMKRCRPGTKQCVETGYVLVMEVCDLV
jgi:hypothetical protein